MTRRLIDELSEVTLYKVTDHEGDDLIVSYTEGEMEHELDRFNESGKYALVKIKE